MTDKMDRSVREPGWMLLALVLLGKLFRSLGRTLSAVLLRKPERQVTVVIESEEGRAADRKMDVDSRSRERWGTLWVGLLFLISLAAGIAFMVVYWTSADIFPLGITLAIFFGAFGWALVLHAHLLMRQREATEEREPLPSPQPEREALFKDLRESKHEVQRRSLLKWMVAGVVGVFAAMFVSVLRSLATPPEPTLYNNIWKRGQRLMTIDGKPMTVNSLEVGATNTVFPEDSIGSEDGQTVLIRVDERLLDMPRDRVNWAPSGYVAYSRVCTHAGCSVGLYETTTCMLLCPCHQSTFDVLRAAKPTSGPAARPLPQLPLYADADGTLRAAGGFSEFTGPGFWGIQQ